jgi:hypothetical protein
LLDLRQKGLSVKDIQLDIVHALGPCLVGYSAVTLFLRDTHCAGPMDSEAAVDHNEKPDHSGQAILAALSEQPFDSILELSRLTDVSKSVIHGRLM